MLKSYLQAKKVIKIEPKEIIKIKSFRDEIETTIVSEITLEDGTKFLKQQKLDDLNWWAKVIENKKSKDQFRINFTQYGLDVFYGNNKNLYKCSLGREFKEENLNSEEVIERKEFKNQFGRLYWDFKDIKITFKIGSDMYSKGWWIIKVEDSMIYVVDRRNELRFFETPKYFLEGEEVSCEAKKDSYGTLFLNTEIDYLDPSF